MLAKKGCVSAGMSWGVARCDGVWSGCGGAWPWCGGGVGRAESNQMKMYVRCCKMLCKYELLLVEIVGEKYIVLIFIEH